MSILSAAPHPVKPARPFGQGILPPDETAVATSAPEPGPALRPYNRVARHLPSPEDVAWAMAGSIVREVGFIPDPPKGLSASERASFVAGAEHELAIMLAEDDAIEALELRSLDPAEWNEARAVAI